MLRSTYAYLLYMDEFLVVRVAVPVLEYGEENIALPLHRPKNISFAQAHLCNIFSLNRKYK